MPSLAIAVAARRAGLRCGLGLAVLLAGGCESDQAGRVPIGATTAPVTPTDLFVPRDMRIHPIFTQMADLTGGGKPDGVEAQLEFDDQFDDPTKASGQVLFELYEYRHAPPFTGRRVGGPWVASLATPAEQRERWNKTLRTYRFPLSYPAINPAQDYVLRATFELTGGGRFSKWLVLTGHKPEKATGERAGPLGL